MMNVSIGRESIRLRSASLPPLLGVVTNAAYDFIEPLLIEPSSIELPSIEPLDFRASIRSIIKQFRISEIFVVAIQPVFEASESKAFPTRKMLSAFCDEMTSAMPRVWCLGWISHMFVTALTKSLRPAHLNDVARLMYEPGQCPVYHIISTPKLFMEKIDVGLNY